MMRWWLAAVLFFISAPAWATAHTERWALRADDTTIMVFDIVEQAQGWTSTWQRPAHFASDGDSFSNVTGPVERREARAVRKLPDGFELTFDGPTPGAPPFVFVVRRNSASTATLAFAGFGDEPAALVRETDNIEFGHWDAKRTYARTIVRPTNSEMTAIFDADQAARANRQTIDWKALDEADRIRRDRTQTLLDAGQLQSADDYYHAAFVFQHGHDPANYLKAHALAVIAAARGKPAATWIAAATLDRYLQAIGQPQIYGTQFSNPGGAWTQEPYRSNLLSDALRRASRVPTLAEQQTQRSQYESQPKTPQP